MTFQDLFVEYLEKIRQIHKSELSTEELSYRTPLENLLKRFVIEKKMDVAVVNEAKRISAGRPDLTITTKGLPIGYLEAEVYNCDLDHLKRHAKEQNQRFSENLDNFILTNHLEFRFYKEGILQKSAKLPTPPEKGKIQIPQIDVEMLVDLLEEFLIGEIPEIANPRDLAVHLARRTRQMKAQIFGVLTEDTRHECEICQNYRAFKDTLIPNLTEERFSDMYAQTITYGLFAARTANPEEQNFTRLSAARLVPKTNPFLRKLFQQIAAFDLDERLAWIADDVAQLLAKSPINDIISHFNKGARQDDPVVHFYETFLAIYDPTIREKRGVYYTPQPVVSYIVRSIDHLLKTRFRMPLGLADEKAVILDPATGTGSFLYGVINLIYETVASTFGKGAWNAYVQDKLLPRIFGFELLMAPYAVAHLKLGLQLQETGYNFGSNQRLGIYLTNTLEEAITRAELLMAKYISDEANEAAAIKKEKPILIVLGNPPYSGHSANRSRDEKGKLTFIGNLIEDYKYIEGNPLNERTIKWLQDDYVKFIRFAQWRIDRTEEGIVGYITNHGYLDNPTFRAMRYNLMQSFDEIYVYNLHGNSKKKEKTPSGGKDENVFEIQQGVAILFCVKKGESSNKMAKVYHAGLWGVRKEKYNALSDSDVQITQWQKITPIAPFYLFVPQNQEFREEYNNYSSIKEIMPVNVSGILTAGDNFVIDFDDKSLIKKLKIFTNLDYTNSQVREKLKVSENYINTVESARKEFAQKSNWEDSFHDILYRPFDFRRLIYDKSVIFRTRDEVMHNMLRKNIGLSTTRSIDINQFEHIFCTNQIITHHSVSIKEVNYIFPLYIYPEETMQLTNGLIESERLLNFSPKFLKELGEKLNLPQEGKYRLPKGISPEDIFHYAYGIFHSPTYRQRYEDFLKIDFPRLPITSDLELFQDLAKLGKELVAFHLLDEKVATDLGVPKNPFPVEGDNKVVSREIRFSEEVKNGEIEKGKVYINKTQYFANVPEEVWEFSIGGYQVCHKWLKDRRNRQLGIADIQHYQKILIALQNTIRLMDEIDERIPGFPIN